MSSTNEEDPFLQVQQYGALPFPIPISYHQSP